MTTTNFSLDEDFIGIKYAEKYLDMHNDYNFHSFNHDKVNNTADINFIKNTGDWVAKDAFSSFKIHFENVKAVYTKDHDADPDADYEYIRQDGSTIDLIGFSYDDDEMMDGPTDTNSQPDLPALIFVFYTGKAIKVTAETAKLMVD